MSGKLKKCFVVATLAAAAALVSPLALPSLVTTRAAGQEPDSAKSYTFVAVGQDAASGEQIILNGAGTFDAVQSAVTGGGSFTVFTAAGAPPLPIVASGTYEAKHFQSFTPTTPATYGAYAGGILIMTVDLKPDGQRMIRGATLKVVCNLPPGGIDTGQPEGPTLTLPDGSTFAPVEALDVFSAGSD
jgi:hypothetical protein